MTEQTKTQINKKHTEEEEEEPRLERHSAHKAHSSVKSVPKKEGGGKGNWGSVESEIKEGIQEALGQRRRSK